MRSIIPQTESEAPIELVGGKAKGLLTLKSLEAELNENGFISYNSEVKIPSFFIIPPEFDLKSGYQKIMKAAMQMEGKYVIRSSSPLEDIGDISFDGIFETCLDVPLETLVRTIHKVRKSSTSQKARKYAAENSVELTSKMPIIVQSLVQKKDETGVVYSRFPCPRDILKIIRDVPQCGERYINALLRETHEGKHYLNTLNPVVISRDWDYRRGKVESIRMVALAVEDSINHPIIMEFACYSPETYSTADPKAGRLKIYPLQARKLTKLGEDIKFQMPELQERGLIANTFDLNGTGDFTGDAYVIIRYRGIDGVDADRLEEFDSQHPQGYILVTPYLQFYQTCLDEWTPNKKAVVAYTDLGHHHDMEISRKKGILYLSAKESLHMDFHNAREYGKGIPIMTGEKVRVVSDGEKGFVFNLSRG